MSRGIGQGPASRTALVGVLAAGGLAVLWLAWLVPSGYTGITAAAGLFPVAAVLLAGRTAGYLCWAAIALLGESVGRRLRRQGLTGATVTLKLKYSYGSGRTAQRRLPHPTDDENIFVAVALELLDNIWQEGMHVRLAGIGMSDFNHQGGIQTDLFCEVDDRGAQSSDRRDLSVAIDAVRDKFGDTALTFGRQSRFSSQ